MSSLSLSLFLSFHCGLHDRQTVPSFPRHFVPVDGGAVALDAALAEDEVEERGQDDAALQRRGDGRRPVEADPDDQEAGERPRDEPVAQHCSIRTFSITIRSFYGRSYWKMI